MPLAQVAIIAPIARLCCDVQHQPAHDGPNGHPRGAGGGFSPISIYGGITNRIVAQAGLPLSEMTTFLASLVVNLAVAVVLFLPSVAGASGQLATTVLLPQVAHRAPSMCPMSRSQRRKRAPRFMGMQRRRLSAKKSLWKRDKRRMRLRLSIRPRELRPRTEHINS